MSQPVLGCRDSVDMDPRLWGQLQHHIDLKLIYAKLPFRAFFQLRLVCKAWSRLASDRAFLEDSFRDPIPHPYFIVTELPEGLLAPDPCSRRWTWTRLPPGRADFGSLEGLLYSYNCLEFHDGQPLEQEIFSVHTRAFYKLPPPLQRSSDFATVVMAVDTSVHPHRFQVILGYDDIPTQVFDSESNAWTKRLSFGSSDSSSFRTCFAQTKGVVYVREDMEEAYVTDTIDYYDLEEDKWGSFSAPDPDELDEDSAPIDPYEEYFPPDIGCWHGCLYVVSVGFETHIIKVLEHDERHTGKWRVYDRVPEDLSAWLTYTDPESALETPKPATPELLYSKFCGGHLLVYLPLDRTKPEMFKIRRDARFIMCNLASKTWERIQVPGDEIYGSKSGMER